MPLVYSLDRVRRLRLLLGLDVFVGVMLGLLAVFIVTTDAGPRREGFVVGVVGVVVVVLSAVTLGSLPRRDGRAKGMATATGAVTLVVGFFFAKMILGFAMIVLGVVVLVLALLRDDPDLQT